MKNIFIAIAVVLAAIALWVGLVGGNQSSESIKAGGSTSDPNGFNSDYGFKVDGTSVIDTDRAAAFATTSVESFTTGGQACTLTDANGGTYTLTDAQTANCSYLTMAAGGAGQAVIALTLPATSTMIRTVPNAGDCKSIIYSAQNLAAATTTTITLGVGHNILAYTTNDDVIDGAERAQITMCRLSSGNVDTFTTEILNAD
jgi:hypothetical protein